jgi:hypothetical protein
MNIPSRHPSDDHTHTVFCIHAIFPVLFSGFQVMWQPSCSLHMPLHDRINALLFSASMDVMVHRWPLERHSRVKTPSKWQETVLLSLEIWWFRFAQSTKKSNLRTVSIHWEAEREVFPKGRTNKQGEISETWTWKVRVFRQIEFRRKQTTER